MAHDIFISYSNKDKAIADAICAKLEERKIRCWIAPRDVPPGANFAGSIVDAIDNCKLFILIWSSNTNQSEHILNELNQAFDDGTQVVPFRIENVEPSKSLKYYIGRTHWLDAMTPPLETHIKTLGDVILTNLGRRDEINPIIPPVVKKEEPIEEKKEKPKKIISQPAAKPRTPWPYLIGLFALIVIAAMLFFSLQKPASPAMEPLPTSYTPLPLQTSTSHAVTPPPTMSPSTPLPPIASAIPTTESKVIYQTKDLGAPYYQSSFVQTVFDEGEWPVKNDDEVKVYRDDDDTYHFAKTESQSFVALFKNGQKRFTNSIIEVEAEFLKGGGTVNLLCRTNLMLKVGGNYYPKGYQANFNFNGRTTIEALGTGKNYDIIYSTDSLIKQTEVFYRLRFDCIGNKLTIYENGVKIGEIKNDYYYVGDVGLNASVGGMVILFLIISNSGCLKYHPE